MTICGHDYCKDCEKLPECGGCEKCSGHPFGGPCIAADTILAGGQEAFNKLQEELIDEINGLNILELNIDCLNLLSGDYVNLEYTLANGSTVKFLNDNEIYLGNQIERVCSERCYGLVANRSFILVSEYGCDGTEPKIVEFKRR